MTLPSGWRRLLVLVVVVFTLDVTSKFLTHHYLPLMTQSLPYPYGGIGVFENIMGIEFSLSHTTNTGAAWGLFANSQHILIAFRIALVIGLIVYGVGFNKNPTITMPLTLVTTGAACNVLDFFTYGHVVDMFHFVLWGYDYPVFNVADTAIFCGIAWLMIRSFVDERTASGKRA